MSLIFGKQTEVSRAYKAAQILIGIVALAFGFAILFIPGSILFTLTILSGTALMSIGILRLTTAIPSRHPKDPNRKANFVSGIVAIIIATVILLFPSFSIGVLITLIGIGLIIYGFARLTAGAAARGTSLGTRIFEIGLGVFLMAVSTIMILSPIIEIYIYKFLFFIEFIALGIEGLVSGITSKSAKNPEEPSVVYNSAVYLFRDYWSNRLKLNRNIQSEDFKIDTEKDFLNAEIQIEMRNDNQRCNVSMFGFRFEDVLNPFKLLQQYEPSRISFPFNKSGHRDESPDPNYSLNIAKIGKVMTEPIVKSKGETKLWLQILVRIILPTAFFTLLELFILNYFSTSVPWLNQFKLLIMALTLGGLLFSSILLFIKIGIFEATRKVASAKTTIYLYQGIEPTKYTYRSEKDIPNWLDSKPYWVLRYLFIWSFELTVTNKFPFVHAPRDIERMDVWLDAKKGTIEWIVSDYHWRELWYKTDEALSQILVWLAPNFHTPRPLTLSIEGKGDLTDLYRKDHPLSKMWIQNVSLLRFRHSNYFLAEGKKERRPQDNVLNSVLTSLWWEKWRYSLGANNDVYQNYEFPATEEQPS